MLIRAFARSAARESALLVIAGPDDEALTPELTRVARDAGIGERVRFDVARLLPKGVRPPIRNGLERPVGAP